MLNTVAKMSTFLCDDAEQEMYLASFKRNKWDLIMTFSTWLFLNGAPGTLERGEAGQVPVSNPS